MSADIKGLVAKMSLKQKASLCSGLNRWLTEPIEELGIPSVRMNDGPHGLRITEGEKAGEQARPAVCFPCLAAVGSSWDRDLAREMGELSEKARQGKLMPADMQGGCMTISSLGGIGGTAFTPIVNAPEVAILGVTRASMKPVWNGQEFVPRLMVPLDLTYDHRVIDGADGVRFIVAVARYLEKGL